MKEENKREYWSMTEGVFNCLIDSERTNAFESAIKNTVKQGDVVVDMGTGTGVLSLLAAKYGAKKVYAVEIDEKNIADLRNTFKINGYENIIEVVEGDVTKVVIPEKVDVIIGEMIATALIEELQIPAMNNILKYAKRDVKVVLHKFENYIDLVFNNNEFYGFTFNIPRYEYSGDEALKSESLSNKEKYAVVNFSEINIDNVIDKEIVLTVNKKGVLNGVRLSSKTIFCDGTEFNASFAYSYPIVFPLEKIEVNEGDKFLIKLKYKMCEGWEGFSLKAVKV